MKGSQSKEFTIPDFSEIVEAKDQIEVVRIFDDRYGDNLISINPLEPTFTASEVRELIQCIKDLTHENQYINLTLGIENYNALHLTKPITIFED